MRELKPIIFRPILSLLAIGSALFVVYASLVPLNYMPLPWPETVARFKTTPWFQLGIERRADWVANGLVMLPAGFFAAAAIDWKRKRRWPLFFAAPLIIAMLIAMVVAIEFVQIWFPPRVVSQNDIFAGIIGSVAGVALYVVIGRRMLDELERFWLYAPGWQRWQWLSESSVICLLLYNLMPLDVLLSVEELQAKHQLHPFSWIPFADFSWDKKSIANAVVDCVRLIPYAFFTTISYGGRRAVVAGSIWACVLELVKIPIHSRAFSVTDIVLSLLGIALATVLAPTLLRIGRRLDRAWIWFLAVVGWSGIMLVGFLARFDSVIRDPQHIRARLHGILTVPFARAHSSSEMEAGENIVVKLVIFAVLSFLLSGWCSRLTGVRHKATIVVSMLWFLVISVSIEIGQVFLYPLVPDATDFIIYALGAVCGITAFAMLITKPKSVSTIIHNRVV